MKKYLNTERVKNSKKSSQNNKKGVTFQNKRRLLLSPSSRFGIEKRVKIINKRKIVSVRWKCEKGSNLFQCMHGARTKGIKILVESLGKYFFEGKEKAEERVKRSIIWRVLRLDSKQRNIQEMDK